MSLWISSDHSPILPLVRGVSHFKDSFFQKTDQTLPINCQKAPPLPTLAKYLFAIAVTPLSLSRRGVGGEVKQNAGRFSSPALRGFTQIELAVTVIVIGVLAAISAPSFLKWQQQRKVDQAVIIFENAIRETQAEAIKRSRDCELRVREVDTTSPRVPPPIEGNCIIHTSDFDLVGVKLEHTYPAAVWRIGFNARGENRTPPSATAIFSVSGANVRSKCVVMSVGIGLHRSGRYQNGDCITS